MDLDQGIQVSTVPAVAGIPWNSGTYRTIISIHLLQSPAGCVPQLAAGFDPGVVMLDQDPVSIWTYWTGNGLVLRSDPDPFFSSSLWLEEIQLSLCIHQLTWFRTWISLRVRNWTCLRIRIYISTFTSLHPLHSSKRPEVFFLFRII